MRAGHQCLCEVGWRRACGAGLASVSLHGEGLGWNGAGACPPGTSLEVIPTHAPRVRAHHLPALPLMPSPGILVGGLPCRGVSGRSYPCPEAAAVRSTPSLFPGPGAGSFTCLSNNIVRIDCRWSAPELGHGPSPWLLFTR